MGQSDESNIAVARPDYLNSERHSVVIDAAGNRYNRASDQRQCPRDRIPSIISIEYFAVYFSRMIVIDGEWLNRSGRANQRINVIKQELKSAINFCMCRISGCGLRKAELLRV